jgi:hypothetical protein
MFAFTKTIDKAHVTGYNRLYYNRGEGGKEDEKS